MLRDLVAKSLTAVGGDGGAGRAGELHDVRLAVRLRREPFASAATLLHEVGREQRDVILSGFPGGGAIDEDYRDLGGLRGLEGGGETLELARRKEDDADLPR